MLVLTLLVLVLEVPLLQLLWTCCLSAETRWAFFSLLEAIYGCRLFTLRVPRVFFFWFSRWLQRLFCDRGL